MYAPDDAFIEQNISSFIIIVFFVKRNQVFPVIVHIYNVSPLTASSTSIKFISQYSFTMKLMMGCSTESTEVRAFKLSTKTKGSPAFWTGTLVELEVGRV
jgi:hypothetical protein